MRINREEGSRTAPLFGPMAFLKSDVTRTERKKYSGTGDLKHNTL